MYTTAGNHVCTEYFDCGLQYFSVMKRKRQSTLGETSVVKKRTTAHSTFEKWKRDFDREFKTVTWLECESTVEGGAKVVTKLKCIVCSKFRSYGTPFVTKIKHYHRRSITFKLSILTS